MIERRETSSPRRFMRKESSSAPAKKDTRHMDGEETVKFVPLGGLDEVGRNCSFFEYKNEIVMIDAGIQFPEEETPGIDFIIPNISSLENRKQNIKGIIFTHGHLDHIHALPYLLEKLGNPLLYTTALTKALIEKRLVEFPNIPKARFILVKPGDRVRISENFEAEFFAVSHTIFDAIGMIMHTKVGKLVHFGDFRLETSKDGKPKELEVYEWLGKQNIHSIFLDSTNARKEGFSLSEELVEENLEKLISGAKGRVILACFASILNRLGEIISITERLGRKVALNGRSMKDNLQIAQTLGYIKPKKETIIPLEEIGKYKDDKIMILTTGSQGEENSGLMRIVNREHRLVELKKSDTVIFSSSVIPGNERSIQSLQDNVARQVDELYNSSLLDIHASGHCNSEDLKLVMKLVSPKFIIPVHGYYFMRKSVVKIAEKIGIASDRVIIMDNGDVAKIQVDKFVISEEKVNSSYVMVDGLGVGDVEEVVLRDRRVLSEEGMIVIIATIDRMTGRSLKNPDIISRGFIYLKENKELLEEIRKKLRGVIMKIPNQEADADFIKGLMRESVSSLIFQKTKRRPMVLPVIIEV
ncbi:MAG: ribonuclease J [Candidatus Pacebacteria bacterium]|nr:ribonuclease J [Candidatus Paceibacterota bacterium]